MGMHENRRLKDIVHDIMSLNDSVRTSNMLIERSEKIINDRKQMIMKIINEREHGIEQYHEDEYSFQRDIVVREREIQSHKLALKTYDNRRRALMKELVQHENMDGIIYREYYNLGGYNEDHN